jgi:4-amino-4-deoxy-L-arabinose transferase-like glycosyltransferase
MPIAVGFVFTFAAIGALVGAVSAVRGRTQGLLAGLMLLGTPFFVTHGAEQYADIPLACFMLISLGILCRANHASQGTIRLHYFSGLFAGMATWTKNEGLLFLLALLAAQVAVVLWKGTWTQDRKRLAGFCAGALPVVLLLTSFKLFLAPPNDLIAGQSFGATLARISQPSRYVEVAKAFAKEFLDWDRWNLTPIVLPFYSLLVGVNTGERGTVCRDAANRQRGLVATWSTLVLVGIGFFFVYVLTPYDLAWHLGTLGRIVSQMWPSLLLATFLTIKSPAEIL